MIDINIEVVETRRHKTMPLNPLKKTIERNITTYKIKDKHIPSVNREIHVSDKDSNEKVILKVISAINDMQNELNEYEQLFKIATIKNI